MNTIEGIIRKMKSSSEKGLRQFRRSNHYFQVDVYVCPKAEDGNLGSHVLNMQTGVNNLKTNKMSKGKYMYVKKNNAVTLNR